MGKSRVKLTPEEKKRCEEIEIMADKSNLAILENMLKNLKFLGKIGCSAEEMLQSAELKEELVSQLSSIFPVRKLDRYLKILVEKESN
ncbi:MAG: hypothetical protein WCT22_05540 [Patescibacteria group bacterium]|jgi:hypothetical protein